MHCVGYKTNLNNAINELFEQQQKELQDFIAVVRTKEVQLRSQEELMNSLQAKIATVKEKTESFYKLINK